MTDHTLPRYALAFGLAALAGMVDALGLLKLGGLFVSFMSGNSTRMAVGIAGGTAIAGLAIGLIGAFVGGVFGGALIGKLAGRWRKQAVLAAVLGMLILAALAVGRRGDAITFLMAAAMGAVNNVFQRDGEVSIGGQVERAAVQVQVARTLGNVDREVGVHRARPGDSPRRGLVDLLNDRPILSPLISRHHPQFETDLTARETPTGSRNLVDQFARTAIAGEILDPEAKIGPGECQRTRLGPPGSRS